MEKKLTVESIMAMKEAKRLAENGAIPGELLDDVVDGLALARAITTEERLQGQTSQFDEAKLGIAPLYPKG